MKTWFTIALLAAASSAHATTAWDEGNDGSNDLSNDRLEPTALTVAAGHNLVFGVTGDGGSGVDRDYFRFTVPAGATLQAIILMPHPATSFFAIQAGPQLTVTPTGGGIEALLGFNHLGKNLDPQDILPDLLVDPAGLPLGAGTYSMWVQETGGEVHYGLDFVLASSVPEPAAALSLGLGLGLVGLGCRRFVLQRR